MECFRDDQIVFDPKTVMENNLHLYMRANTDIIGGLVESFVEYQVEAGKMDPVERLYEPLYDNVFDLIERLGIQEAVTATMRSMMINEEHALQHLSNSAT